jgi:hypothetical protein
MGVGQRAEASGKKHKSPTAHTTMYLLYAVSDGAEMWRYGVVGLAPGTGLGSDAISTSYVCMLVLGIFL